MVANILIVSLLLSGDTLSRKEAKDTTLVKSPSLPQVALQSAVAEATFAGTFFALRGNRIRNNEDRGGGVEVFAPAVSTISCALVVSLWGNGFSLGHNNFWRPFLGEWIAGFALLPFASVVKDPLVFSSILSLIMTGGAVGMYYFWPTDPDIGDESHSGFRLAPIISPGLRGIWLSYGLP